jgi:TolB-like protein/AraC-like DNA-binding protein
LNKIVFTDQSLLDSLYKTIEENLLNEQFGVEELARELGISRSQLHRQLHDLTGKSTSQVIREYRLEKARELLENETATVAEVSYQVGFGSPSYFNTCFHEYFGYTPGEVKFRKTLEKKKRPRASKKFILLSLSILAISALIYYSWSPTGVKVDKISEPLIPDKSIAMLPLKYLSEDPSKQYMADGILDAIIGQLSIIKDLRVTPRTTIEQYRETTKTARAIGEELNVTYLIEGSFWMQDDQVRLIIQLVSPQSEDHIWDKEYVSELEDIFAVESEITQTIAKEIGIEISPERTERIESVPTENMDAYELFMKGQHYQNLGPSGKIRAIKYYEQAMALDPDFALPYLYYGWEKFGIRNSDALAKDYGDSVLYYTKKAIELDPDLDIAYYRLGVYYNGLSDDDNAIYYLKKTLDLNPNHARAYMQLGWVYGRMGRYIDKIISLEKGKKLATGNPNNFAILSDQLGDGYIWIGYHEKAEEAYREVLKIDPIKAYSKLGALCMGRGDWDMMKLYTDKLCAIDSGETCSMMLYKFYLHTEDFPKALKYADFHRETGRELDTYEILIQFDKIFRQAEYGYVLSQNNRKAEARVYYDKQIY